MDIRILQEKDAAIYQALRLNALKTNPESFGSTYEREAEFSMDTVAERIKPTQDKFVLGAFDHDGCLLGSVTFMRETGLKTTHKGNVYGLYVAPVHRRKGIGKALLLELIKMARHFDGLELIHLTVVTGNLSAKKLYQSVGFTVYGTEERALKYSGQYYDEDLMVFFLSTFLDNE